VRVYLTKSELETTAGGELLDIALRIAIDGKLDLDEIKELRRWLRAHKQTTDVAAVGYLQNIMTRITADNVIDRDELLELHLAIERVIPTSRRTPVIQARKAREAKRRDHIREKTCAEKEESRRLREEEYARRMRLRHTFAKVAGVTFQNDDGSERQSILKRCRPGEQLILRHDPDNAYSICAVQVLRTNGEQLGHAPGYLGERICEELEDGYWVLGVLAEVTGGTRDKPTRGANFAVFFMAQDVSRDEVEQYANNVFAERD
jgi:hypothetical protein